MHFNRLSIYRLTENKWFFIVALLLFRVALEYGYFAFVTPNYTYSGFVNELNAIKYFESWILLLFAGWFVPWRLRRVSDYLVTLAFTGLIVPLLSLYGLADHKRWIVYAVLFQFFLLLLFRRGRSLRLVTVQGSSSLSLWICIGLVSGLSVWYVASGGIAYMNFDLTEVYKYRRSAGDLIAPGLLGYINPWIWKIFGPLLLAIALWKRWWGIALAVLASYFFWFSVANHKAILFYPLIIVAIWYWFRRSDGLSFLPLGFAVVVVSVTVLYQISGEALPASLFVRRLFYVIANNTFDYYYYFSENTKVFWSSSNVSLGLVEPVYTLNPADLIGEWRGTDARANNSFLSTGYMHGGWWGLVVYGVIGGLVFRLVDTVARGAMPLWVALSAFVIPGRSLVLSADLPTALLTHGIGLAILMVWLMNGSGRLHRSGPIRSCVPVPAVRQGT